MTMGLFGPNVMAKLAMNKAAVRSQGSALLGIDYHSSDCRRCGHRCNAYHRPGKMGRCHEWACTCLYCITVCTCGHDSVDHEPWGAERTINCGRCGCAKFTPTPSTNAPLQGGQ
jgi:hypothetical protein